MQEAVAPGDEIGRDRGHVAHVHDADLGAAAASIAAGIFFHQGQTGTAGSRLYAHAAIHDELLDRVWWDAAGELTPCASPLGKGALGTYAVRLKVALKRQRIDAGKGGETFERLAQETQIQL